MIRKHSEDYSIEFYILLIIIRQCQEYTGKIEACNCTFFSCINSKIAFLSKDMKPVISKTWYLIPNSAHYSSDPTVPLCLMFLCAHCSSVPTVPLCLLFLCAYCSSVPTVPLFLLFLCAHCASVPTVPQCPLFLCAPCAFRFMISTLRL